MPAAAEDRDSRDADRSTGTLPLKAVPARFTPPGAGSLREADPASPADRPAADQRRPHHLRSIAPGEHPHGEHHHHLLIEPQEDRWRWRRKIREDARKLAIYRVGVGIAGLLLVCLGFVSGPLPGPGGIPLVLLGLAIWASEFEWAHRLMLWFKALLHRFRSMTLAHQLLAWLGLVTVCGGIGYLYMLVIGPPPWLPTPLEVLLQRLPGV